VPVIDDTSKWTYQEIADAAGRAWADRVRVLTTVADDEDSSDEPRSAFELLNELQDNGVALQDALAELLDVLRRRAEQDREVS
jgi:hypothetical protein